ncbi:uncharacterized protein RCC_00330 [Ramularia collo-cygni]|uniref:DOPA 4,5-dioxygenase n=1 Tax=Ramularia collo-cygni TaxID=112498 RepID=A0A2D3V287_9PEZI|nr:uncharacterized protein RCC_00330 [Ramularia collo-cygni]CZT14353.1 uncharacterized protein RCC_00330 [Ramularia collo-cygni]
MDPNSYEYTSPLDGWQGDPLSNERNPDGKSLVNPAATKLSAAYESFTDPIRNDERGGFDIHIYYLQSKESQVRYATELHERVRREFPELRVYQLWDGPVGPHPIAMFEVNVFTPLQFGAFVSWLVIHRGPLSALIHPNTGGGNALRDHTQRATWLGQPYPLDTVPLRGH